MKSFNGDPPDKSMNRTPERNTHLTANGASSHHQTTPERSPPSLLQSRIKKGSSVKGKKSGIQSPVMNAVQDERTLSTSQSYTSLSSVASPRVSPTDLHNSIVDITSPTSGANNPYIPLSDDLSSQQFNVDDDLTFVASGRRETSGLVWLYYALCILTGGAFYLACRWYVMLEINFKTAPCRLSHATHILIKNQWNQICLVPVKRIRFGGSFQEAFPQLSRSHLNNQGGNNDNDSILDYISVFEYRYFRFLLNPQTGLYEPNYLWQDPNWLSVRQVLNSSHSEEKIRWRQVMFGQNQIDIEEKSTFSLLIDEVLHPFFIFQIASIILWLLDNYYYYAACIFIISTTSAIATLIETKNNIHRMKELSRFSCQVRLWRDGSWRYHKSEDMMPGDLFEMDAGGISVLPCDAVLLVGDCIVNESMLTGESLPISKAPITDADMRTMNFEEEEPAASSRMSKFFLFAGTKIIRVRQGKSPRPGSPEESTLDPPSVSARRGAIGLVVRTGFNTAKGNLVRSMTFPRPNNFKFYRDSFRFIGVLAVLAALGFLFSLYNFISMHYSWKVILIRALDLITIVVPPALPATMAIGTSFAISRLRKLDIFCISPPRVNICGKINVMCFDKTGTLTEEGLDVLGIRFTVPRVNKLESPVEDIDPLTPLRFSRLYRTVGALQPKPVSIPPMQHSSVEENSAFSPLKSFPGLSSYLSGASVHVVNSTPHALVEKDFPYPLIICAMATCHSIKVVHGSLMGDSLDLKMFEFSGWHIEEEAQLSQSARRSSVAQQPSIRNNMSMVVRPPWVPDFDSVYQTASRQQNTTPATTLTTEPEIYTEMGVIRSFEFLSSLRRMSVIVRRVKYGPHMFSPGYGDWYSENHPQAKGEFEVFVKGAPEVMEAICFPESLPDDYNERLREYTHHGYRVIACAYKKISGMNMSSVNKLSRGEVESNLRFLGFIVFENKLKPGTTPVIETLNQARIRQVMCTGDNLLTAISVSRECGLVQKERPIFAPRFVKGTLTDFDAELVWEDIDRPGVFIDPTTFLPPSSESENNAEGTDDTSSLIRVPSGLEKIGYDLAISGDAFQWMLEFAPDDIFYRMIVKCQIYSRMSPDQKHFLVENLQSLGYCVGFCGDGTNDCGALKAADAGLSLSEAEASVAAPFTSKDRDLDCVLRVIREGRAALVTSFCCFKYMALYSLIQFTSVSLLYSIGQNIGDEQFMYIDLALIIPTAVFMGQTGPHPRIHPKRPTATLVSKKVLTSMIGQVLIQSSIQFFIFFWIRAQPWYKEGFYDNDEEIYRSFENTAIFLSSSFQYVLVAIVFTVGPPYQEPLWKNIPYLLTLVLLTVMTIVITLFPTDFIIGMFDLVLIPWEGRVVIFGLAILNFVLSCVMEWYVFPWVWKGIGYTMDHMLLKPSHPDWLDRSKRKQLKIQKWEKKGKLYRIIEEHFKAPKL